MNIGSVLRSGAVGVALAASLTALGLGVGGFLGGTNLAALLATAFLFAAWGAVRGVEPFIAALGGLLASIFSVFMVGAAVVPILRRLPFISDLLFRSTALTEVFEARTYVYSSLTEAKAFTSLLMGLLPVVLAAVGLSWQLRRLTTIEGRVACSSAAVSLAPPISSFLIPLVLGAFRKWKSPYEYLASTMSGDGRNFFLKVQDLRVTSTPTSLGSLRGQGDFLPSLGAHLSGALGSDGLMDVRDQYSIAAVYVLMSGIIVLSVGTLAVHLSAHPVRENGVEPRTRAASTIAAATVVTAAGILVATFSPLVNEVFRSGFLSQYGAFAFVAAFLAVGAGRSSDPVSLALQLAALVLLTATYPLAAGVVALVFLRNVATYGRGRVTPLALLLVITAITFGILVTRPWSFVIESVRSRAALPGAIVPGSTYLWVPILLGTFALLVFWRPTSSKGIEDIALVVVSGILVNELILSQRESQGLEGWGYYGEKNIYITNFAVTVLVAGIAVSLVLVLIERAMRPLKSTSTRASLPIAFGVIWALLVWIGGREISQPQSLLLRQTDWIQPRAGSVELAFSTWPAQNVMYLDSGDPGEARMLNFWLPYAWRGVGWNWAYLSSAADPVAACETLAQKPAQVLSFDTALLDQVRAICDPPIIGE